jgi:hypothetical protein
MQSFYANLLLKLSLTQSILITTFTSRIQYLLRWFSLLSIHSSERFCCFTRCSMLGRNCCHLFPDVLFQIHRCPWFLFVHLALEISLEEGVLWPGTFVPLNIEVPTKYPLSQDRIVVFENRLHSKSSMLYRPVLYGNWNALSIARRALKDNPHANGSNHSCAAKIVRYFFQTLCYPDVRQQIFWTRYTRHHKHGALFISKAFTRPEEFTEALNC